MVRLTEYPTESYWDSISTENISTSILKINHEEDYPQNIRQFADVCAGLIVKGTERIENPVLQPADVTDLDAEFVADPFIIPKDGIFYLLFEVKTTAGEYRGGYATSEDGYHWTYGSEINIGTDSTNYYTWYPVKRIDGEHYILTGDRTNDGLALFKATNFPTDWELLKSYTVAHPLGLDPITFKQGDTWYLLDGGGYLYYSDSYFSDSWTEHPSSPLSPSTADGTFGAGRPIVSENSVIVFERTITSRTRVIQHKITNLSPTSINITQVGETPVIATGTPHRLWDEYYVHHLDFVFSKYNNQPLIIGDSQYEGNFEIGVLELGKKTEHASIGLSVDYTLAAGTTTTLPLDNINYDSFLTSSTVVDTTNNKIDIPKEGYYRIDFETYVSPAATGSFQVRVVKNGTDFGYNKYLVPSAETMSVSISVKHTLAAGDELTIEVVEGTGSDLDFLGGRTDFAVTYCD